MVFSMQTLLDEIVTKLPTILVNDMLCLEIAFGNSVLFLMYI